MKKFLIFAAILTAIVGIPLGVALASHSDGFPLDRQAGETYYVTETVGDYVNWDFADVRPTCPPPGVGYYTSFYEPFLTDFGLTVSSDHRRITGTLKTPPTYGNGFYRWGTLGEGQIEELPEDVQSVVSEYSHVWKSYIYNRVDSAHRPPHAPGTRRNDQCSERQSYYLLILFNEPPPPPPPPPSSAAAAVEHHELHLPV